MEQREENTPRIRRGRLAAAFLAGNLSATENNTNQDAGRPGVREEEDQHPIEIKTDQAADGGGDAAASPVVNRDSDGIQQENGAVSCRPTFPQGDGACASSGPSGDDNPERARLRDLLASGVVNTSVLSRMERELVLKIAELSRKISERKPEVDAMEHELREKRAEGEVLQNLLSGVRSELRLLRREMAVPQGQRQNESAPLFIMDYAIDEVEGAAAERHHGDSSQTGQSDEAAAFSLGQVSPEDDLDDGDLEDNNGSASDGSEQKEQGGEE